MATRRPRTSRSSKSKTTVNPPPPMDDVLVAPVRAAAVAVADDALPVLTLAEELALLEAGWDEPVA